MFEGSSNKPGFWREYEGGVQDWLIQSERTRGLTQPIKETTNTDIKNITTENQKKMPLQPVGKARKLSYKEQRELEALPNLIASLETEQKEIRAALNDSGLYASDPKKIATLHERDTEIEDALMSALERWEQLSSPT